MLVRFSVILKNDVEVNKASNLVALALIVLLYRESGLEMPCIIVVTLKNKRLINIQILHIL